MANGGNPPAGKSTEERQLAIDQKKLNVDKLKVLVEAVLAIAILTGTWLISNEDRQSSLRQARSQLIAELIDVLGDRDPARIQVAIAALQYLFKDEPEELKTILATVVESAGTGGKEIWVPKPQFASKQDRMDLAAHHFQVTDTDPDPANQAFKITWVGTAQSEFVADDLQFLLQFVETYRESIVEFVIADADWLSGSNLFVIGDCLRTIPGLTRLVLHRTSIDGDGDDEYLQGLGTDLKSLSTLEVVGPPRSEVAKYVSKHSTHGAPNSWGWLATYNRLTRVKVSHTSFNNEGLLNLAKNKLEILLTADCENLDLEALASDSLWPGKLSSEFVYWDLTPVEPKELSTATLAALLKLDCERLVIRLHGWTLPENPGDDFKAQLRNLLQKIDAIVVDDNVYETLIGESWSINSDELIREREWPPVDFERFSGRE